MGAVADAQLWALDMGRGHREVAWASSPPGTAPDGPQKHRASGCEDPGARHSADLLGSPSEEPLREGVHLWSRGTPGACLCGREAVPTAPLRQGPLQSALGGGGPSPEDPGPWARLDGQATPDGGIHRQLSALQPGQGRGSRDTVGARGRRPQGPAWPGSVGGRSWASGPALGVPGLLLMSLAGEGGPGRPAAPGGWECRGCPVPAPGRRAAIPDLERPPRAVVLAREEDRRRVRWCLRTPIGKPAPSVLVPSPPPVPVTPDLQAPSPSRSWWRRASFPPPLSQGAGQWVPGGGAGSPVAGCWYGRGCQPAGPREPPTPLARIRGPRCAGPDCPGPRATPTQSTVPALPALPHTEGLGATGPAHPRQAGRRGTNWCGGHSPPSGRPLCPPPPSGGRADPSPSPGFVGCSP